MRMIEAINGPHDGARTHTPDNVEEMIFLSAEGINHDEGTCESLSVFLYPIEPHPHIEGAGCVYSPEKWPGKT